MKNCIITGGNSGVGYAAAMKIAERDFALTLICRNEQRAKKACEEITEKTGNSAVSYIIAAQGVEADMIQALLDVPTRAAVLDVTSPEPPEADSPLYTVPNVFLTSHIAGSLGNEVHRMAKNIYMKNTRDSTRESRRATA